MVGDTSYEFNMLTYLYGERTPIRVPIEVFVFLGTIWLKEECLQRRLLIVTLF